MKLFICVIATLSLASITNLAQADQTMAPVNCRQSTFMATLNCAPDGDYLQNVATLNFNGNQFVGSKTDGSDSLSGTVSDCSNLAQPGAKAAGVIALAVIVKSNPSENKIVELLPVKKAGVYLVALSDLSEQPGLGQFSNGTELICSQK